MRIGFDVDGVLARFNEAFEERLILVTGEDRLRGYPGDKYLCWNWPEAHGYSEKQISATWDSVKQDPYFWQRLSPYLDAHRVVQELDWRQHNLFDEVYYVTARPGIRVRFQTEAWLEGLSASYSGRKTVLISSQKGLVARALELDAYIDDKWENCLDVIAATTPVGGINYPSHSFDGGIIRAPRTKVFLVNRPWNTSFGDDPFITRVDDPFQLIDYIEAQKLETSPI